MKSTNETSYWHGPYGRTFHEYSNMITKWRWITTKNCSRSIIKRGMKKTRKCVESGIYKASFTIVVVVIQIIIGVRMNETPLLYRIMKINVSEWSSGSVWSLKLTLSVMRMLPLSHSVDVKKISVGPQTLYQIVCPWHQKSLWQNRIKNRYGISDL